MHISYQEICILNSKLRETVLMHYFMDTNFKHIHIGSLLRQRMEECAVDLGRAATFLKVTENEIEKMCKQVSIDSVLLLQWSKLLEYDFFRIYTQHLILYAPQDPNKAKRKINNQKTDLPIFKKNIYTEEVISYLIEMVENGRKTGKQIQDEYNIPSTTILRWINKYGKNKK